MKIKISDFYSSIVRIYNDEPTINKILIIFCLSLSLLAFVLFFLIKIFKRNTQDELDAFFLKYTKGKSDNQMNKAIYDVALGNNKEATEREMEIASMLIDLKNRLNQNE